MVVVIPALAEYGHLFDTLAALCAATEPVKERALALCVVNNHEAGESTADQIENNRETLARLRDCAAQGTFAPLTLAWVDASSQGHTLPQGEGVGLARKIGLDHGLCLLAARGHMTSPLVSLDADAPPAPGYLDALAEFYAVPGRWAGYAAYLHSFPDSALEREAVIAHELYMRYHEISLQRAASPYAYPALGSIISCTGGAYAASGGMNRRRAGEDFYFMQQLAKTGAMEPVPYALVHPSGRSSCRTPFGTGRTVAAYRELSPLDTAVHPPASYDILRRFLLLVTENAGNSGDELMETARSIHPALTRYLEQERFQHVWELLRHHHPDPARRVRQFHVWFDGLRTIQFLHRLRASGFPDVPAREALPAILPRDKVQYTGEEILNTLRETGLARHALPGQASPAYSADAFLRLPATS